MADISREDVENVFGGPFVEYAIKSLEQYGFHHTAHMQWDEMKRLARLGAAVENMAPLVSLCRRGSDQRWEAEDEIRSKWSGAKDSPFEALEALTYTGP